MSPEPLMRALVAMSGTPKTLISIRSPGPSLRLEFASRWCCAEDDAEASPCAADGRCVSDAIGVCALVCAGPCVERVCAEIRAENPALHKPKINTCEVR